MARLAGSLVVLRNEVNALAPSRSKVSDGWIGDPAHASRASRHNPNRFGVVTALDITHDPARGCDIHALAGEIRRRPHPELAYIISAGRICSRTTGWAWHVYTGSNKHNVHAHFAVGVGPDSRPEPPYDSPQPWGLLAPAPEEDDMPLTEPEWARLQEKLNDSRRAAVAAVDERVDALEGRVGTIVEDTLVRILTTGGHKVRTELRRLAQMGANDAEADDAPDTEPG